MRGRRIETVARLLRRSRRLGQWLLLLAILPAVHGCEEGRAQAIESASTHEVELRRYANSLYPYGGSAAQLSWWPNLHEAPVEVRSAAERAGELLSGFSGDDISAFSISYSSNDLPQVSLLIRRGGNRQLLVYNHGHSGLPEGTEDFARRFLRLAIDSGYDLLVVSMPLTGLNAPIPGATYHIRTRDSVNLTPVDAAVIAGFEHGIYEAFGGPDNYIRYFVDGAILPVSYLHSPSWRLVGPVSWSHGNAMPADQVYDSVNYVGLSGGATTGLTTCGVLALRRCVLVAGVMPDDLRLKYPRNFGDAEQQSRSVHEGFSIDYRLRLASESTEKLVLLFNQHDSCCFGDPAATEFQQRYPEYDVRVRPLDYHGYEPELILSILD